MNVPWPLIYTVRLVLEAHYRSHHPDGRRADAFADAFLQKLFIPTTQADAGRAVAALEVMELPRISAGADETYRLAAVLRETLCREIRQWLVESGVWRFNIQQKALAYARAIASSVDGGMYLHAAQTARHG